MCELSDVPDPNEPQGFGLGASIEEHVHTKVKISLPLSCTIKPELTGARAWVFAAGLVLGFSLFPQEEARHDIEDAFTKSRLILETLAELSPQAKHYHEILSNFAEAISKYQQRIAYERQHTTSQYVNQIFNIDVPESVDWRRASAPTPTSAPGFEVSEPNEVDRGVDLDANAIVRGSVPVGHDMQQQQRQQQEELELDDTARQQLETETFTDARLLWDDSSTQLLGSFPLDYETFGMLFEGVGGFTELGLPL